MADVGVVLLLTAFFGVCVLLVKACERVIGPDESVLSAAETDAAGGAADAGEPVESVGVTA